MMLPPCPPPQDAALDVLRKNYEAQLKRLEDEAARLRAELNKERNEAPSK